MRCGTQSCCAALRHAVAGPFQAGETPDQQRSITCRAASGAARITNTSAPARIREEVITANVILPPAAQAHSPTDHTRTRAYRPHASWSTDDPAVDRAASARPASAFGSASRLRDHPLSAAERVRRDPLSARITACNRRQILASHRRDRAPPFSLTGSRGSSRSSKNETRALCPNRGFLRGSLSSANHCSLSNSQNTGARLPDFSVSRMSHAASSSFSCLWTCLSRPCPHPAQTIRSER